MRTNKIDYKNHSNCSAISCFNESFSANFLWRIN